MKQDGLTFIELLLALAISVLIAGVVLSVLITTWNSIQSQLDWRTNQEPAARALDLMQRDMACALIPVSTTNPPIVLESDGVTSNLVTLSFYTCVPSEPQPSRIYGIRHVSYTFRRETPLAAGALTRAVTPFRVPPEGACPAETLSVARNIANARVALFDGTNWVSGWTATNSLPRAARFSLEIESDRVSARTFSASALIPSGMVFDRQSNSTTRATRTSR